MLEVRVSIRLNELCLVNVYTVLQLITNQQPYSYIKHTTEVVIKSAQGARPRRPTELHIIARGLDDNLWNIMTDCWNNDPADRPSIDQVLAHLP